MQARYYDPVIGRFLSNDPVGFVEHAGGLQGVQGFNRYAYVNNNPYKFTDSDGRTATVSVDKNNNVNITLVNAYSGPGASAAVISRFNSGIQSGWSGQHGKYNVSVTVRAPTSSDPASTINNVTIVKGPQTSTTNMTRGANGQLDATNSGAQWDNADSGATAAHEAGHQMGLEDKYTAGVTPAGKRTTTPTQGYQGNIMGDAGPGVKEGQIEGIIQDPGNVVTCDPGASC